MLVAWRFRLSTLEPHRTAKSTAHGVRHRVIYKLARPCWARPFWGGLLKQAADTSEVFCQPAFTNLITCAYLQDRGLTVCVSGLRIVQDKPILPACKANPLHAMLGGVIAKRQAHCTTPPLLKMHSPSREAYGKT